MLILTALKPIFVNGQIVEAESIFSCHPDFAKKLIESDSAKMADLAEKSADDSVKTVTKSFLESKSKAELIVYAKEQKVDGIRESNKKAEIIEAILKVVG